MSGLWLMAAEIAELDLEGLPNSDFRLREALDEAGINKRRRPGKGTRGGYEYLIDAMPPVTAAEIRRRWTGKQLKHLIEWQGEEADLLGLYPQPAADLPRKARKAEAAKVIAALYMRHRDLLRQQGGKSREQYAHAYKAEVIVVPAWVRDLIPSFSPRSLQGWLSDGQLDLFNERSTPVKREKKSRATVGLLNDGEVGRAVMALVAKQPQLTARQVRRFVGSQYPELTLDGQPADLPHARTFARYIREQKDKSRSVMQYLSDPDGYKAKRRFSLGKADAEIVRLNQIWEIDASPADVMLTEGRHSIYALIDVWSRRLLISVSATARTDAALALIRTGLERWGVPEAIRTDNGADFTSYRFVRAMADLGVEQIIAPPFSPEKKPFVERAIGTFQRDFCRPLPGFIGHNVGDRQRIRAATAFSSRLGQDEGRVFSVQLDRDQFAEMALRWCEHVYAEEVHSSLGMTPREKARSWTGEVRRIANEAVLALLLAPVDRDGIRTVTKQGIRVSGANFFAAGLEPGQVVFVRHDPDDMGVIYLFTPSGSEYLGRAINVEREGIDRKAMALKAKAEQKRRMKDELEPLRKDIRKIKAEDMINAQAPVISPAASIIDLPKRSTPHTSPNLQAAGALIDQNERRPAKQKAPDMSVFDTPVEPPPVKKQIQSQADYEMAGFREFLRLKELQQQGVALLPQQEHWLNTVQKEPWFEPAQARHEYLQAAERRRRNAEGTE